MLAKIAGLLPTQTRRSEESQNFQQFSTPVPLGLAALTAAAITPDDRVLEPSAGTGLLAILAQTIGGSLILNELADTRADLLAQLFPAFAVTRFDAAQIDDHLPPDAVPSVVLMNPPFSVMANVSRRVSDAAYRHVASALARLAPGGRLVTITGAGFGPEAPAWRDAFIRLQARGRVVFTAAVDGAVYAKHGTTIDTRLRAARSLSAGRWWLPARELVSRDEFEGIPEEFETLADGLVLLVRRFDRGADGQRVHIEDFAQVFGLYPARKYDGAASHDIASVLNVAISPFAALDFVRRLTFSVVMGNGDMHLKNWSLIYPGAGDTPALAPVYDMLATVPYIPADGLALSLGGERAFKGLNPARWKAFANRARLPEPAVLKAVAETVRRIDARWWTLPEREVVPPPVLERIDAHVKTMIPILTG